jgi:hypothetical protein
MELSIGKRRAISHDKDLQAMGEPSIAQPEHPMPSDFNVLSGELTQFAEMQ